MNTYVSRIAAALEQAAQPVWTTAKPTTAGWYWLRAPKHGWRDAVLRIEKDGDGPDRYCYIDDEDATPVDEIDGEWAPCVPPGEVQP